MLIGPQAHSFIAVRSRALVPVPTKSGHFLLLRLTVHGRKVDNSVKWFGRI